jgi:flagellar assembly factor FliW
MDVTTTRFGTVAASPQDILLFEHGLIGFEPCKRWLLLADSNNHALGWLQSVDHAQIAMAIVSPRRFIADYQLRLQRCQLDNLQIDDPEEVEVVVIVSRHQDGLCLNLKAPLVIHIGSKTGCQVISSQDYPIRHQLAEPMNASSPDQPCMALPTLSSAPAAALAEPPNMTPEQRKIA